MLTSLAQKNSNVFSSLILQYSEASSSSGSALEIGLLFFGTTSDLANDDMVLFLVKCLFCFSEDDLAKLYCRGFTQNFDVVHAKAAKRSFQIFSMDGT